MYKAKPFIPSESWTGHSDQEACRRLLVAILERAIFDLASIGPERAQALNWIMSDTHIPEGDINSFKRICSILNLDYRWLRNRSIRDKVVYYYQKSIRERKSI